MASMNPNPFTASLHNSERTGIAPRAAAFHVPTPPAAMFAVMAATESALAPTIDGAVVPDTATAAPATASEASQMQTGAPVPAQPRSPSSTESASVWSEGTAHVSLPLSPDVTATIGGALIKLRRAKLTRLVRVVVMASALVCVAAVGRVAISAAMADPDPHAAAPSVRAGQDLAKDTVRAEVDALSERTLRAMSAATTSATPRAPARATASRHHRRW